MNKQILFLLLGSIVCTTECARYRNRKNNRPKVAKAQPKTQTLPPAQQKAASLKPAVQPKVIAPNPQAPKTQNQNAAMPKPAILPIPTMPKQPAQPIQPDLNQIRVEVRLSDKTIYLTKEQAEALASKKIDNSGFKYADFPNPVDLTSMDSKTFEFMQKLSALNAQKLYIFLENASNDAFTLIKLHANLLQLQGKFEGACKIKMAQDPQLYGKTEYWALAEMQAYTGYEINSDGIPNYSRYGNKVNEYFGNDYWAKYQVDSILYNESPQERERVIKAINACTILSAHINYHQAVFQKPLSLKTDFLKECFYKLDISHQNKLINDNLVVLT